MKILYYVKQDNSLMSHWQVVHIFDELKRHNCQVEAFNLNNYKTIDEANEALLKYIKNNKFDLFMTGQFCNEIYAETLECIKNIGLPMLLICFDNLVVPYRHISIAKYFDYIWLTSVETKYLFDRKGLNAHFQPYAANPFYFQPNWKQQEKRKICFIGTPYGSRINLINDLLKADIPVALYADKESKQATLKVNLKNSNKKIIMQFLKNSIGRKIIFAAIKNKKDSIALDINSTLLSWHDVVQLSDLSDKYSGYALALSTNAARNTGILKKPVDIVNLRSFEIPMCGGLQFCRYTDELSNYFEDGKEIIFYYSKEDMIDKAKFYLRPKNEKLRFKIKLASRRRAENEHTWFIRFNNVFENLGLTNYEK